MEEEIIAQTKFDQLLDTPCSGAFPECRTLL